MLKFDKGIIPDAISDLFQTNMQVHGYNTRNKHKLVTIIILIEHLVSLVHIFGTT